MGLSPLTVESQALHRVGHDGSHLGVRVRFSSEDWRTPSLSFQYSIDGGRTWRPLARDEEGPRTAWSAVVYGVRSQDSVLVRAVLGDEAGPTAEFSVMEGVDASTEHLKQFVPRMPALPSRPVPQRRLVRRNRNLNRSAHFSTGSSEAYHSSPDCPALRGGQSAVEWRGGTPAGVVSESVTDAIFEGKRPCRVCRPPGV